jgi:hypothetical protein
MLKITNAELWDPWKNIFGTLNNSGIIRGDLVNFWAQCQCWAQGN